MKLEESTRVKVKGAKVLSGVFSGGEVQVRITDYQDDMNYPWAVQADIHDSQALMETLLVGDALSRINPDLPRHLLCPYMPYARQDRVCAEGESLSLAVVSSMLSAMYSKITVWDAHSDVTLALNYRLKSEHQKHFIRKAVTDAMLDRFNIVLVAPDAGAQKKTAEVAKDLGCEYVTATKVRDASTGQITNTKVDCEHIGDKSFLIVDDIIDGGRTFIELEKKIRPLTNSNVMLYATHGIMSQGHHVLEKSFDKIFVANPFYDMRTEKIWTMNRDTFYFTNNTKYD